MKNYSIDPDFQGQLSRRERYENFENNLEESFSLKKIFTRINTPTDLGPWDTHNIVQPQEFRLRVTTVEGTKLSSQNNLEKQQNTNYSLKQMNNSQYSKQLRNETNKMQVNSNSNQKVINPHIQNSELRLKTSLNHSNHISLEMKSTPKNKDHEESPNKNVSLSLRTSLISNGIFSPKNQASNVHMRGQYLNPEMQGIFNGTGTTRTDKGFGSSDEENDMFDIYQSQEQYPRDHFEMVQFDNIINNYTKRSSSIKKRNDMPKKKNEHPNGYRSKSLIEEVMKQNNLIFQKNKPTKDIMSLQVTPFKSFDGKKIIDHLQEKETINKLKSFILVSPNNIKEKLIENKKAKEGKEFMNNALKILKRINIQQKNENRTDYKPWLEKMTLLKHGLLAKRGSHYNNDTRITKHPQFRIINTPKIEPVTQNFGQATLRKYDDVLMGSGWNQKLNSQSKETITDHENFQTEYGSIIKDKLESGINLKLYYLNLFIEKEKDQEVMLAFGGLKDFGVCAKKFGLYCRPKDPISADKNSIGSVNLMKVKLGTTPKNRIYTQTSNTLIGGWMSPSSIYNTPTNKRATTSKLMIEQNIDRNNIATASPSQWGAQNRVKKRVLSVDTDFPHGSNINNFWKPNTPHMMAAINQKRMAIKKKEN